MIGSVVFTLFCCISQQWQSDSNWISINIYFDLYGVYVILKSICLIIRWFCLHYSQQDLFNSISITFMCTYWICACNQGIYWLHQTYTNIYDTVLMIQKGKSNWIGVNDLLMHVNESNLHFFFLNRKCKFSIGIFFSHSNVDDILILI